MIDQPSHCQTFLVCKIDLAANCEVTRLPRIFSHSDSGHQFIENSQLLALPPVEIYSPLAKMKRCVEMRVDFVHIFQIVL